MKRKQRKSKYQLNMPDVKGAAGSFFKNAGNKARALLHRGGRRASQSLDRGAARLGEPPIPSGTRPLLLVIDLLLLIAAAGSVAFAVISATADSGQIAVTLNANGLSREFAIWPATVEEFLDANGIEHDPDDEISLPLEAQLQDGDTLTVRRCFPVAVHTKGATSLLRYTQGTVGDALSAAGVTADADDEISYLTFADLKPGMQIVHTEVDVSYASSNKTLEFSEETIKDDSHYEDFKKVEQEGSDGLKQITQRITLKDGMEVSREVVDQVVLEPAVDRIVRVGTKIKYQTNYDGDTRRWKEAPTAGKNGWTKMVVECTAYNTYGRTATGTTTKFGTIAVNPKCIPYGTQMYVPKYGYGVARDTGGFRHEQGGMKNQIDVWIKSESACRRWGRKYNLTILVKLK